MPLLNHVAQSGVYKALLFEDGEAAKLWGGDVNGIHGATTAGDILDEELGRLELGGEEGSDGGFGGGHGGWFFFGG